jgi:hypothetical protein
MQNVAQAQPPGVANERAGAGTAVQCAELMATAL